MTEHPDPAVIVCIDDELPILSALRRLFRNEPYEFLATDKPDVAMTWVLEKKADLILADQRMPGISGLDLLETVRMCSPETVRIMLTGHSDLTEILKVRRIEAIDRLVRKPWDADELKRVVRTLLADRPDSPRRTDSPSGGQAGET